MLLERIVYGLYQAGISYTCTFQSRLIQTYSMTNGVRTSLWCVQLERIVGSEYANRMIESKKGTFTFM
jgi:hypothetical protein